MKYAPSGRVLFQIFTGINRIIKTDTPTLNRGISQEGFDYDPMMDEDIIKAKVKEENIKLYKAFNTHNKKFGLKTTPPALKREVSYETGFSYDPEIEARKDFTSIPKYTPLKNSIRTRIDSSTKLPVTDLNRAPQRGADSNLHRYKSPKTSVGGKSKKYRNKNKRRSTRRRR